MAMLKHKRKDFVLESLSLIDASVSAISMDVQAFKNIIKFLSKIFFPPLGPTRHGSGSTSRWIRVTTVPSRFDICQLQVQGRPLPKRYSHSRVYFLQATREPSRSNSWLIAMVLTWVKLGPYGPTQAAVNVFQASTLFSYVFKGPKHPHDLPHQIQVSRSVFSLKNVVISSLFSMLKNTKKGLRRLPENDQKVHPQIH